MTTIIMLFALPIGIALYFWDRKNVAAADKMYEEFIEKTLSDGMLSAEQKLFQIDHMFYMNGFHTLLREPSKLIVEQKHLNLGIPIILFALLSYIGVLLFIIYYFYLLKPIRKEIDLS